MVSEDFLSVFFRWSADHGEARLVLNSNGTGFIVQDGKRVFEFVSVEALMNFIDPPPPVIDFFEGEEV